MPREITPEVRKLVGLPKVRRRPFRARLAVISVSFGAALALWGYPRIALIVLLVALGFLPVIDWWEFRDAKRREAIYREGEEAIARIIEVEPGGRTRRDHIVRLEFFVGRTRVETRVIGAPLARRGIGPGDDVIVVYDQTQPTHCLIVERVSRA